LIYISSINIQVFHVFSHVFSASKQVVNSN